MALINCPECTKEISDKVKTCPHCGYPFNDDQTQGIINTSNGLKERIIEKRKPVIISLLIVLSIVAVLLTTNNINLAKSNKEKATLFKDSVTLITKAGYNSADTCSIILNVWSNAGSRDFNDVFKYMFSGDIKNHEWSGIGMDKQGFSTISWGNLANEMNSFKDRLDNLEVEKTEVDSKMEQIKQIERDENEKEIDGIVDYYNEYLKLYNAATNPSGNQLNYSSNLITMKSDFDSAKVELDMLIK